MAQDETKIISMNIGKYQPVIGLEVHIELKTKSKMFCGCSANYFGHKPNTHCCPVCLGLPGALPVPNKTAIEWCLMIGLALNCKIPLFSKFDRKNYFYPDLPKGYQISQYDKPFCVNGKIVLKNGKKINIKRVHMEEDTGKLIHATINGEKVSLIDFNRSGVPLVEIVTEPDFENATEVVEYLKKLQQIVRYLNVSNADMEKGDMRFEPNVSLQKRNTTNTTNKQILPIYKVEVKNINSFRFVEKAINYEIERQKEILSNDKTPIQETRGWDENEQKTISQRVKEEAHDYRYFPEPDIPPISWEKSHAFGKLRANLKSQIPELPDKKLIRFKKDYGLPDYDAEILVREKSVADYFDEAVKIAQVHNITPKQVANYVINKKIDLNNIFPAKLIQQIMVSTKTGLIDKEKLEKVIEQVLAENQKAVRDYKRGKENVMMFLIGSVMRKLNKKIDPIIVSKKLKEKL